MSLQETPVPANPTPQLQLNDPTMFAQVAFASQLCFDRTHSLMSMQVTPPSVVVYPTLHLHVKEPPVLAHTAFEASQLFASLIAHSFTSTHDTPEPEYPTFQRHVKDPATSLHSACTSQLFAVLTRHSLTFRQAATPFPV
jgi:hypothetical protein